MLLLIKELNNSIKYFLDYFSIKYTKYIETKSKDINLLTVMKI